MNLVKTILLFALSALSMWQNDQKTQSSYTVSWLRLPNQRRR